MPTPTAVDGEHVHYHKDGSIWAKGQFRDGQMDGYWEWFRRDGTKLRSGHFEEGQQVGEWITYDKQGRVYKVTTRRKSKLNQEIDDAIQQDDKTLKALSDR